MNIMHALAVLSLLTLISAEPGRKSANLSIDQVKQLATSAMKLEGVTKTKHLVIELDKPQSGFEGYYLVEAYLVDSTSPSAPKHAFAINKSTGDVWDWVNCVHYSSKSIIDLRHSFLRVFPSSGSDRQRKFCKSLAVTEK
jgi:hypothetical protein